MTENEKRKFTVISNTDIDTDRRPPEQNHAPVTPPNKNYHTNPIYEKLLKYKEEQKKKRFTVEDLLKW